MLLPVLLHGGLKDGVTNWVPSMIQSNFGISPAFSAAAAMALPLVNLSGAYLSGWLNEHCAHNELKTAGFLFALASVCLLALPLAMRTSLLLAVLLLAVTTASMLVVNTMFINVIPVKAGRHGGASMLSGTLNAVTYLGAAAATWGIGAAAEGFGWNAVFLLWLVMAMLALLVSALLAGQFAARSALPAAPLYNLQIRTPVLGLKCHTKSTASLPFVLCLGGTCTVELLPVTDGNGLPLASDAVQAVRITRDGQSVTVIFCHKTGAHDAALLCADGCAGHGSVLVFTPQSPEGFCLR